MRSAGRAALHSEGLKLTREAALARAVRLRGYSGSRELARRVSPEFAGVGKVWNRRRWIYGAWMLLAVARIPGSRL